MNKGEFYKGILYWIFWILLFGGVITMISLLSLYVNVPVKQTEYAVGYDTYNMKFTKIYDQGKYTIKVGENLIKIRRTLQDYNKVITCMTSDKILIDLEIGIQYLYQASDLIPKILREFGSVGSYDSFLSDRITSSVLNSCLKYESEQYYMERSTIDNHIYSNLIVDINDKKIGVNVEFYQLINIRFPIEISNAISQKQNIEQEALTAQNNRNTLLTEEKTKYYEAERQANILIINANNQANITLNQAHMNSQAQTILWTNRAYAYEHVKETLGLNSSLLIDYIQTDLISKSSNLYSNLDIN